MSWSEENWHMRVGGNPPANQPKPDISPGSLKGKPMVIDTKYAIGDEVLIRGLDNWPAVVTQICIGVNGQTYQVHWFHEGSRKEAWLFDHELVAKARG